MYLSVSVLDVLGLCIMYECSEVAVGETMITTVRTKSLFPHLFALSTQPNGKSIEQLYIYYLSLKISVTVSGTTVPPVADRDFIKDVDLRKIVENSF